MARLEKIRLDRLLVNRGLVESREKGQALISFRYDWIGDRPLDANGRVIPPYAGLTFLAVLGRALVQKLRVLGQSHESMCETRRNIKHLVITRGKLYPVPLPERR